MLELKELDFSHTAIEGGFHSLDVEPLLRAAPNIEKINFHVIGGACKIDPALMVKELHLSNGSLAAQDLEGIILSFPNAEEFSLESRGIVMDMEEPHFTLSKATDMVLDSSGKLKEVYLDMRDAGGSRSVSEVQARDARRRFAGRGIEFELRYREKTQGGERNILRSHYNPLNA
ncbi:hypothetical protein B0T14DRAFT_569268 [Immersiella caudata]|uniref:Uncharacterized protein n=1 Tax=Immersiella caudata TaxID=314043 RepID=A0AA39U092_9PEZI|nr:hypothetical protein B0T14DRAFT_569268 [Immersiella caudata]